MEGGAVHAQAGDSGEDQRNGGKESYTGYPISIEEEEWMKQ
jgi:hypothetical protein